MNRVLKYAWYQLIVILIATVFAAAVFGILAIYWRGKEFSILIPLGLFALVGFYRVFFPLKAGEIAFDERDEYIINCSTKTSFVASWYMFALGCLIPVVVIGNGSIHVMYLGWMVFVLAILCRIVWSIAVIIQYGRGVSNE